MLALYFEFNNVAIDFKNEGLLLISKVEHSIELQPRIKISFDSIYSLSGKELEILYNYLNKVQKKGQIQKSEFLVSASILFVSKKNGILRLYINYRDLNNVIIKNQYSLSLITKILDCLSSAQFFTKFNLYNIYYCLEIRKLDRQKIVFHTRYS